MRSRLVYSIFRAPSKAVIRSVVVMLSRQRYQERFLALKEPTHALVHAANLSVLVVSELQAIFASSARHYVLFAHYIFFLAASPESSTFPLTSNPAILD